MGAKRRARGVADPPDGQIRGKPDADTEGGQSPDTLRQSQARAATRAVELSLPAAIRTCHRPV
jgi:hypothetical protein